MRHLKSAFVALLLLALPFIAIARDLDKSDPVRKEILDSLRGDPKGKFIVKDLVRDGDLAYACVIITDQAGEPNMTDESMEVNTYLLIKQGTDWFGVSNGEGFTGNRKADDCHRPQQIYKDLLAPGLSDDAQLLQSMWLSWALDFVLSSPNDAKWNDDAKHSIAALHAHGLLKSLPIELKSKDVSLFKYMAQQENLQCSPNSACMNSVSGTFARLRDYARDTSTSSAVWVTCGTPEPGALYTLASAERCIAGFREKEYCRAGQDYFRSKADVKRCISEIQERVARNQ